MNESNGRFVVIAEFHLKTDVIDDFIRLAREDANQSLTNEPGCHQFDVLRAQSRRADDAGDESPIVVLHEVYSDRAAFDQHTQMPHYAPFKEGTAPLLAAEPKVRFFDTVE